MLLVKLPSVFNYKAATIRAEPILGIQSICTVRKSSACRMPGQGLMTKTHDNVQYYYARLFDISLNIK